MHLVVIEIGFLFLRNAIPLWSSEVISRSNSQVESEVGGLGSKKWMGLNWTVQTTEIGRSCKNRRSKRFKEDGLWKWTVLLSKNGWSKRLRLVDLKGWNWAVSEKTGRSEGMELDDPNWIWQILNEVLGNYRIGPFTLAKMTVQFDSRSTTFVWSVHFCLTCLGTSTFTPSQRLL